jgi:spore photoproduct lyase
MITTKQKGSFIKHCPCSPETVSCGYYNLNLHTGCPYSCSYCILLGYLNDKSPVFYTNFEDLKRELCNVSRNQNELRLGTGELSDSLAYDPQIRYSSEILSIFKMFPTVVFEFKTKSVNIKNLLDSDQTLKNVVISWSLNPSGIVKREECGTPSLSQRLRALKAIAERGYRVGIHFDPIIFTGDWKILYKGLVRQISSAIDPQQLVWISLGTLRFPYSLREFIFKHPQSRLFEGELIRGYDGKYRYFKPQRLEMFRYMKKQIREKISREIPLYLCMEDLEAWEDIFPEIDPDPAVINHLLYQSVFRPK